MLKLYDAARCPYCARVRVALAEKGVEYEPVAIDLADRPAWLYDKNPSGKVPVLEEDDGFVLPESAVIMEYLEELYPQPALLPEGVRERSLARVWIDRFDARYGDTYYAVRRGDAAREELERQLGDLDRALALQPFLSGGSFGLADVAYLPWIFRTQTNLGFELGGYPALEGWVLRLSERPTVAAELELVAALAR